MLRTSILKELIKSQQSRLAQFDSKKTTAHHYIKNLQQINVIPISKVISINVIKFRPTTTTPNYKFIRPLISNFNSTSTISLHIFTYFNVTFSFIFTTTFALPSKPPLIPPSYLPSYSPSIESHLHSLKAYSLTPLLPSKKLPSSKPTVFNFTKNGVLKVFLSI